MSVKLIQYNKESNGIILQIFEKSDYRFQVYYKNIQIHDINIFLDQGQFFWISWDDPWVDKVLEIYSNGIKIKTYDIIGKRSLQKKILESYDYDFIVKL